MDKTKVAKVISDLRIDPVILTSNCMLLSGLSVCFLETGTGSYMINWAGPRKFVWLYIATVAKGCRLLPVATI